jgi:hypothetical protein
MKKKFILIVLVPFFLISCKTTDNNYNQNLREVRYFQSRIHNIDKNIITLADI